MTDVIRIRMFKKIDNIVKVPRKRGFTGVTIIRLPSDFTVSPINQDLCGSLKETIS